MMKVGGQEIRETDSLGFQQTHSTNQGPQFVFESSFCGRRLPREFGEFYVDTIGGGVRGDGGDGGRRAIGSGRRGTKVEGRRLSARRGGGDCGSSRGEIGGRGRRGGSGGGCCGGTGFFGQALKDGSSGCEGLIRASHCALLLEHEYIERLKKMKR